MIHVKNHYKLKITINGIEFTDQWLAAIQDLSIIEQAGVALPILELNFETDDSVLIRKLGENTEVQITWESDGEWSTGYVLDCTFIIINPQVMPRGSHGWKVHLVGIHKFHTTYINSLLKINLETLTSLEEMASLVAPYGKFKTNIPDLKMSRDPMLWISNGTTVGKHLKDVWLHSQSIVPNSVTLLSPALDGFRIYDLEEILKYPPQHKITNFGGRSLGTIGYDPGYSITTNSALLNTLGAKGIKNNIYDLDSGDLATTSANPKPKLKMVATPQLHQNQKCSPQYNPTNFLNRNVHPNWHSVYTHNVNHLLFLSTVKVSFTFDDCIRDIHPLDSCLFLENDLPEGQKQSTEQNSGIYIVTKVSRRLIGNRIATLVEMCRESQKLLPP